jgi:PQQ-like domain/Dockerin type I domain
MSFIWEVETAYAQIKNVCLQLLSWPSPQMWHCFPMIPMKMISPKCLASIGCRSMQRCLACLTFCLCLTTLVFGQTAIWEKSLYGPTGLALFTSPTQHALDSKGSSFVSGNTVIAGVGVQGQIIKLSASDGAEVWRFSPADTPASTSSIATDANDDIFTLINFNGGVKLVKLDGLTGAVIWQQALNRFNLGDGNDTGGHLLLDGMGSVYISLTSTRGTTSYTGGVAKFDAGTGSLSWDKNLGTIWSHSGRLAVDASGDIFITTSYLYEPQLTNWETLKLSRIDGSTLWRKTFDGTASQYDYPKFIAVDAGGNVVVSGSTNSPPNGASPVLETKTIKYAGGNGDVIWASDYASFSHAVAMTLDATGDVILSGSTILSSGRFPIIIKQASATGSVIWQNILSNQELYGAGGSINSLAIGANGGLITAGYRTGQGIDTISVRRFHLASGSLIGESLHGELSFDKESSVLSIGPHSHMITDRKDNAGLVTSFAIKLNNTLTVPSPPTGVTGVPGANSIALTFSPPTSNGGLPIAGYQAECMPGNIVATAAAAPIRIDSLSNGTSYECSVSALNALGFGDRSPTVTVVPSAAAPVVLVGVSSRKSHGIAGTFNLPIDWSYPTGGTLSIEPRSTVVPHTIVFQFNQDITSIAAAALTDAAMIPFGQATAMAAGRDIVVTLDGVADRQIATVSVSGINGSIEASAMVGFLFGDINASRSVNASDILAVKAQAGATVTVANFRSDINASGQINASDIVAVKTRSGLTLR